MALVVQKQLKRLVTGRRVVQKLGSSWNYLQTKRVYVSARGRDGLQGPDVVVVQEEGVAAVRRHLRRKSDESVAERVNQFASIGENNFSQTAGPFVVVRFREVAFFPQRQLAETVVADFHARKG